MTQHGFARDSEFRWLERDETGCRLELVDTPATRQMFPFAFSLVIEYRITQGRLTVGYCVTNPDSTHVLPASLGAHPAFIWPLAPDVPKDRHVIEFDQPEPEGIRRLKGGLLLPESFPTPIKGRVLHLDESLFTMDALILDRPASRGVTYRIPDGPGLRLTWDGFAQLGIWMKPGGDFICIEPWHGLASPVGSWVIFPPVPACSISSRGRNGGLRGRLAVSEHDGGSGRCIFHATPAGTSPAKRAWIGPEICENIIFATTCLRRSVRGRSSMRQDRPLGSRETP